MRPLFVIGTRPEAIKLAPVIREFEKRGLNWWAYYTGQHAEETQWLAFYFEIAKGTVEKQFHGTPCQQVARYMFGIEQELERSGCDVVVAQGDTFSVSAAAQAAFYRKVPFVHVEAGLRTWDMNNPWPEEFHRRIASLAASLHCCPTRRAFQAIVHSRPYYPIGSAILSGNTIVDALNLTLATEEAEEGSPIREMRDRCNDDRGMVIVTAHRRENQGGGITRICSAVTTLSDAFPSTGFFWPLHSSPAVQEEMRQWPAWPPNVAIFPSPKYPKFCSLLKSCSFVMSDSGGIAEECATLEKPLLILRNNTERVESIEAGVAKCVGTDIDRIVTEATALLTDGFHYTSMQGGKGLYGDGKAAEKIVTAMQERFT